MIVGVLRKSRCPPKLRGLAVPSANAFAGLWRLAQETVPSEESRLSKKSSLPSSTFAGVYGLSVDQETGGRPSGGRGGSRKSGPQRSSCGSSAWMFEGGAALALSGPSTVGAGREKILNRAWPRRSRRLRWADARQTTAKTKKAAPLTEERFMNLTMAWLGRSSVGMRAYRRVAGLPVTGAGSVVAEEGLNPLGLSTKSPHAEQPSWSGLLSGPDLDIPPIFSLNWYSFWSVTSLSGLSGEGLCTGTAAACSGGRAGGTAPKGGHWEQGGRHKPRRQRRLQCFEHENHLLFFKQNTPRVAFGRDMACSRCRRGVRDAIDREHWVSSCRR